ncbi:MAG: hypothetical protein KC418_00030 [Anaerolineales bacterium]|nr:hypothetical protein [Anaerolineales bacterium]MCB8950921.1 hypothetical protein [Ardenticatenales bacterium]
MNKEYKTVEGLSLRARGPTQLSFAQLFAWVIWQFPRAKQNGMCGAVRPPNPDYGWFPALIQSDEEIAAVYAHLEQTFSTPEAAADWLATLD